MLGQMHLVRPTALRSVNEIKGPRVFDILKFLYTERSGNVAGEFSMDGRWHGCQVVGLAHQPPQGLERQEFQIPSLAFPLPATSVIPQPSLKFENFLHILR